MTDSLPRQSSGPKANTDSWMMTRGYSPSSRPPLPETVWVRFAHNTGGLSIADHQRDHRYVPYVRAPEAR